MISVNFITNSTPINNACYKKTPVRQTYSCDSISFGKNINVNSKACRFFGVDDRKNLWENLENQVSLIRLKCKDLDILPAFPKRVFFSVDNQQTIENAWNRIWLKSGGRKFDELLNKPARLTFDGKFFGKNGNADSHTIGILYEPETKTLFCLDSLSNECKQVQEYQDILKNQIFDSPNGEIERIIFSNKHQQDFDEYTCNNWAIANIEALQKALKAGTHINNTAELNSVLPDDISSVLQEQYEYVLRNK